MIRVLTFLSGEVMEQVEEAFSAEARYNIGAMVGRLAHALRDFFHPYACSNVASLGHFARLGLAPQMKRFLTQSFGSCAGKFSIAPSALPFLNC